MGKKSSGSITNGPNLEKPDHSTQQPVTSSSKSFHTEHSSIGKLVPWLRKELASILFASLVSACLLLLAFKGAFKQVERLDEKLSDFELALGEHKGRLAEIAETIEDDLAILKDQSGTFKTELHEYDGAQRLRVNTQRVDNYLARYGMVAAIYLDEIERLLDPDQPDPSRRISLLRAELDDTMSRIVAIRQESARELNSKSFDASSIQKLHQSIHKSLFCRFILNLVHSVYGSRGDTQRLQEFVSVDGWDIDAQVLARISRVRFSSIEADLIEACGRDILLMQVGVPKNEDVRAIREALNKLNVLRAGAEELSDAEVTNAYINQVSRYLTEEELKSPFYEQAFGWNNRRKQMAVYVALYDTGLLDLRALMDKYCLPRARIILNETLDETLDLFDLADLDALVSLMMQASADTHSSRGQSQLVLLMRDRIKQTYGQSEQIARILSAPSIEEYVFQAFRYAVQESSDDGELQEVLGLFIDSSENATDYSSSLTDLMELYNVIELDQVCVLAEQMYSSVQ